MSKGRRKHSPAFKAKVAVEVVKGHAHPSAVACEPFAQAGGLRCSVDSPADLLGGIEVSNSRWN